MAQKTIPAHYHKNKNLSVKGKSNSKISRSLIIDKSNVRKAESGSTSYKNFGSKKAPKDDLCTHCGIRKKGPGFRFLCRYCFRKAGDEPVYSINPSTISKDIFSQKIHW
ncbi:MAG: hypothetical protein P8012_11540 [Desulfobacterales bacterium]